MDMAANEFVLVR